MQIENSNTRYKSWGLALSESSRRICVPLGIGWGKLCGFYGGGGGVGTPRGRGLCAGNRSGITRARCLGRPWRGARPGCVALGQDAPGLRPPEAGAPSCLHCPEGLEVGSVAIGGAEGMGAAARLRSRTEVGGGLGGAGARPLRAGGRRHLAGLRATSHPERRGREAGGARTISPRRGILPGAVIQ